MEYLRDERELEELTKAAGATEEDVKGAEALPINPRIRDEKQIQQVAKLQEQLATMQSEVQALKASGSGPGKRVVVKGGTVLNKAQIIEGPIVFVSGQTGYSNESGGLISGGVVAEARQALANLEDALKAAGSDFTRCLKVNVYLTSMDHYKEFNDVYLEVFCEEAMRPARTCVAVAALPIGACVEVEAVACLICASSDRGAQTIHDRTALLRNALALQTSCFAVRLRLLDQRTLDAICPMQKETTYCGEPEFDSSMNCRAEVPLPADQPWYVVAAFSL